MFNPAFKHLGLGMTLALCTTMAMAADPVAYVVRERGQAQIERKGVVLEAEEKMALQEGDTVITNDNSMLQVRLSDNSTLNVAPKSRLRIDEVVVQKNGQRQEVNTELLQGVVRALVTPGPQDSFRMGVAGRVAAVRGTTFILEYKHDGSGGLFVAAGEVVVRQREAQPAPAPVHMMIAPSSLDRVVEPTGGSAGSHSDSEVQQRLALPPASKAVAKQLGMDLKTDGSWSDVKTWKAERVNNLMKMTEM